MELQTVATPNRPETKRDLPFVKIQFESEALCCYVGSGPDVCLALRVHMLNVL